MFDREKLHREMLAHRIAWYVARRATVQASGFRFWEPFPVACWEQAHVSPLAVINHLWLFHGVEGCVEYPLTLPGKSFKVHLDIWIPRALLAVELDGAQHREDNHALSDQQRDQDVKAFGIEVLRFTNEEVWKAFPSVILTIVNACKTRGYDLNGTAPATVLRVGDPTSHYLIDSSEMKGLVRRVEVHSDDARNLGLEYDRGKPAF